VTPASFAIADYGSVVVPTTRSGTELVSLFVDRHVAVVDEADVLPGWTPHSTASAKSFAPGRAAVSSRRAPARPRTWALWSGAHGPSEVRVIVVEETDE